jgi:hypothetical protein
MKKMSHLFSKNKGNRKDTRYPIHVPAYLVMKNKTNMSCIVMIRNICCGGALVQATMPVERGDTCGIHVKLPYQQKWFGRSELEVVLQGNVIRADSEKGIFAIQFFGDYKLNTALNGQ